MDARAHFGYGIFLTYDDFDHFKNGEDIEDEVASRLVNAFGLKYKYETWGIPDDCPVQFVLVDTGETDFAIFVRENYEHRDWDDNQSRLDPRMLTVAENAKDLLTKSMEALGIPTSKVASAGWYMLCYLS